MLTWIVSMLMFIYRNWPIKINIMTTKKAHNLTRNCVPFLCGVVSV